MSSRGLFADHHLKPSRLPSFRAEHFPYSGPHPWLDCDDAADSIAAKLAREEISVAEADICRYWIVNGYIIIENLFDPATLDEVWGHYETAIRRGRIKLLPESVGENDPWPGRYLNPHKKSS